MFDSTRGAQRERIDRSEAERLLSSGALQLQERQRSHFFDGRFLTASDLTREQTYFLSRQASLGRALGAGVVHGLRILRGSRASSILIEPGHGVTALGESVVLPSMLEVNLADIPEIQRLDAAFGLLALPREPARNLSGLYIVALRPVEYSANPVAAYPTTIDGKRSVEDGDIIEATAITLIPYQDQSGASDFNLRRGRVARQIFLGGAAQGAPSGVLPLAMVALSGNVIQWVDSYLVRREVGAEHGDVLGLGFAPRVTREAHILQYHAHLDEIIQRLRINDGDPQFAASEHFELLPPAGRLPKAAVNASNFTQTYFPVGIEAELSIIPEDELTVLVEESLLLPPIDLSISSDELISTDVLILAPVPRQNLRTLKQILKELRRPLAQPAPNLRASFKPRQALDILRQVAVFQPLTPTEDEILREWRNVLNATQTLWYVRRRNLNYKSEVTGAPLALTSNEFDDERGLTDRLRGLGLTTRFGNVKRRGSAGATSDMVATLAAPKFAASRTLIEGAIRELEAQERLDRTSTLRVIERFAEPRLGEGVVRLENVNPNLKSVNLSRALAQSGAVPELDRLARKVADRDLTALASEIEEAARTRSPQEVAALIKEKLR
jgi:hypothetical protein